ncbi:MAG: flagellar hook-length control protein FliK [Phycisphaerales bacterium]|nr:flagellar hook-length control protein FliK [Phycisphaerales bacterium]
MFPTASTPPTTLDARWAEPTPPALDVLETGFSMEAVRESMRQETAGGRKPLSEQIAEQEEAQHNGESDADAQDQPETSAEEAHDSRLSPDAGPVSVQPISSREVGSQQSEHPLLASSRILPGSRLPVQAQRAQASIKPDSVQSTSPDTLKAAPSQSVETVTANTVVRNVPAAVLRAIEVEASLEAGMKGNHSPRLSMGSGSAKAMAARSLADAELRTLQGMTSLLAQRGGRMRIQLQPVQLGPIQIEVEVDGDRVRAVIETATRSAGKILEASTSRLKAALEAQGYTLDRLDIRAQSESSTEAKDGESTGDDSHREDSDRTNEDGRSARHWQSASESSRTDEDVSFADIVEQEPQA